MVKIQTFNAGDPFKFAQSDLNPLFKNPQTVPILKLCLFMAVLAWILYGIFYQFMPPQVPLLFSRPWGLNQLVNKVLLIIIPGSLTALFLINIQLARICYRSDRLMALILLWSQVIISFLALTTLVRLMFVLA